MTEKKRTLTVTGTGDALFTARFPREYDAELGKVAEFIHSCDVRLTNLETNLSGFDYYGSAYSGGTWLNTRPEYFPELLRYGFQFFGTANNHVMDYSYGAMLSTIDVLERHGVAHAGTGRSLDEAAAPAILTVNGQKIAVFAVDSSMEDASRAGRGTRSLPARPGVNYLRHRTSYRITEEQEQQLRAIAADTRINFTRQMSIDTGFLPLDPPGFFCFGDHQFTTRPDVPGTSCHPADKARLLEAVKRAKAGCDAVFILVHCHDDNGVSHESPPEYLEEFARACVDSGASAVFGGGCHSLRPLEIYHHAPIFYSLGDFIYQGLTVEYLPADFMEKFGADISLSAYEALMVRARGGKVGLHCHKKNFQTVLPKVEYTDGVMTRLTLLPLHLHFGGTGGFSGLPAIASGKEGEEIFRMIRDLSLPYGTAMTMENGVISVALP